MYSAHIKSTQIKDNQKWQETHKEREREIDKTEANPTTANQMSREKESEEKMPNLISRLVKNGCKK